MKLHRILLTSVFTTAVAVASSCATAGKVEPLAGEYKVHRFSLSNGLKLLIVKNSDSPTFAYQTWFNVGSRNEVPGKTGLAHLFEHMMFKETKNLKPDEFDRTLEKVGAEGMNAFTSRDYTAYVQELPVADGKNLDLIAKMESDRMVNLLVNEKALKTETEVVQNERRLRNENSPDGTMYQEIFGVAFTKHPYRWPVIGYEADLASMTAKDAMDFYKSHYAPNRAVIVIVGDVNPSEAFDTVKKYYGSIPAQPDHDPKIEVEPEQKEVRRKTLKLNIQVEKLMMGFHTPEMTHADAPALDVLRAVLATGKSSRLQRSLVDMGLCGSTASFNMNDADPSLLMIMANMQKGRRAAEAEAVILKELKKLSTTPVGDDELSRAKNQLTYEFYSGLDSASELANFIGQSEIVFGNFSKGMQYYDLISKVTADDLMRVAKNYLKPEGRTVLMGVSK
ncbi:MAG: insulinase family protein [Bdellovibrionales bacterium]|nr:insulinase family protein [Bdellovibrionales bacterium]